MDIILSSAGFKNKNILNRFVKIINKNIKNEKILFIPTAAINDGGKAMLPFCIQEIIETGIQEKNIITYEISQLENIKNLNEYSVIYVAGGDTNHLVNEMIKYNFKNTLDNYLQNGGIYFGVSAGSIALTNSFNGCLKYINCKLNVHQTNGNKPKKINLNNYEEINLTDNQAIIIKNNEAEIFE